MALGSVPDEAEVVDFAAGRRSGGADQAAALRRRGRAAVLRDRRRTPSAIAGPRRLALLGILSNAWDANPTGWTTAATTLLQAIDRAAVSGSDRGDQPGQLLRGEVGHPHPDHQRPRRAGDGVRHHRSGHAVARGRGHAGSSSRSPPNSQASAQVPVQAISNGRVTARRSACRRPPAPRIGPGRLVQVNVVAGWEGPVFTVLAVLVVAFFAFGIVRHDPAAPQGGGRG